MELVGCLATTLVAAFIGGFTARAFRLPILVGYLIAGVAIGPYTPGFIADESTILRLANVGVALLMFAVGVQLSLKELHGIRRTAIVGGISQIAGTIAIGIPLGRALGWGTYGGLFLGCTVALSSTAVMMSILEERGDLGTAHGTVMMGILLVQDLAVMPMAILLPALAHTGGGQPIVTELVGAVGKAALLTVVALLLASRLVPPLLERVASLGSRELLLLAVVSLCLVAGGLADILGLGMALGAFMAGIVISESDYAHETLSLIRPVRDVFASVFFVSIGMLLNPRDVIHQWPTVLAVVLAIMLVKAGLLAAILRLLGWNGRVAITTGLGLAQIGEFSFVLATMGKALHIIPDRMVGAIYASALVTIMAAPFLLRAAPFVYRVFLRVPHPGGQRGIAAAIWAPDGTQFSNHCIVIGSGRIGRYVSDALLFRSIPQVIVDYDTTAIQKRRERNLPVIYGDATSSEVLRIASPTAARLAVVSLPDQLSTETVVRLLKQMAPDVPVIARVHSGGNMQRIHQAGASAVIHAEFEASVEMIRETLVRLPVVREEVEAYLESLRAERYAQQEMA